MQKHLLDPSGFAQELHGHIIPPSHHQSISPPAFSSQASFILGPAAPRGSWQGTRPRASPVQWLQAASKHPAVPIFLSRG